MSNKNNCCDSGKYSDHSAELPRLNRVEGQLNGIKKMIEENRYCPDILIQLKAVRSAIRSVEKNILANHLKSCVVQSFASDKERDEKIEEIKNLFYKYED